MLCFSIISDLKLRKFLEKILKVFKEITSQLHTICQIIEGATNLRATLQCVDFSKEFISMHKGKIEQILLVYCLHKETAIAIIMLLISTKRMIHSHDRDTIFNIVIGVLQGCTLTPYFLYSAETTLNINSSNKRKWVHIKKGKKQTISCRNYNRCKLHIWPSTSCKYNSPSRIPIA